MRRARTCSKLLGALLGLALVAAAWPTVALAEASAALPQPAAPDADKLATPASASAAEGSQGNAEPAAAAEPHAVESPCTMDTYCVRERPPYPKFADIAAGSGLCPVVWWAFGLSLGVGCRCELGGCDGTAGSTAGVRA